MQIQLSETGLFVLRRPPVLAGMNWFRKKKGKPVLELPEEQVSEKVFSIYR